jgi:peptide/nickel transport system permease protein
LRRVLYAVPIALGVTLFVFALVHLAPGDPLSAVVAPDTPAEIVERLKVEYGFDEPLPAQYLKWLVRAVSGDLGYSVATGRPVAGEIAKAVANTLILALAAALLGLTFGCLFGTVAGYFVGRPIDKLATGIALVGISIPYYWLGIVLVIVFSVELNLLPAMGMAPPDTEGWRLDWNHLRHLLLPAIALCVVPMGIITRTVRATVAEVLGQEFVQALRAKGLKESSIFAHVVKNAAPITLAVVGLQLGYLLGGSILVETVFSWPGTGFLLYDAVFRRDIPLLQGIILVLALFFVFLNLLVDIVQPGLDPRMRRT